MYLNVSQNAEILGEKVAKLVGELLVEKSKQQPIVRLLVSTGASQFEFFQSLIKINEIPWQKIEIFHLDEYIGIGKDHKASFRKYLNERLVSIVKPRKFYEVHGEGDIKENISILTIELLKAPIDVGVIGIGENAHIAFNDPPADFDSDESFLVLKLDEKCKIQQVNEGWFNSLEDVPQKAISMSVSQILKCKTIISAVPHLEKAQAIKATLESDEITPLIPATALKKHNDWHLYLDEKSASLLEINIKR